MAPGWEYWRKTTVNGEFPAERARRPRRSSPSSLPLTLSPSRQTYSRNTREDSHDDQEVAARQRSLLADSPAPL